MAFLFHSSSGGDFMRYLLHVKCMSPTHESPRNGKENERMNKWEEIFLRSCRKYIEKAVGTHLDQRDACYRSLSRRQDEHEQRLSLLEAQPSKAEPAEPPPVRVTMLMLTALRKRLGISQRQLALLLGTTPAAVCNWEKGTRIPGARYKIKILDLRQKRKRDISEMLIALEGTDPK